MAPDFPHSIFPHRPPTKKDDIIYEQPLKRLKLVASSFFIIYFLDVNIQPSIVLIYITSLQKPDISIK